MKPDISRFLKTAVALAFFAAPSAFAFSSLSVSMPVSGVMKGRGVKTYHIAPTNAPIILLVRGDISRIRTFECTLDGVHGSLFYQEDALISSGVVTQEDGRFKFNGAFIVSPTDIWAVNAEGKATRAERWEFNNSNPDKNTVANLYLVLCDDDVSKAKISNLSFEKERVELSPSEMKSLSRGHCPPQLLQRIRDVPANRPAVPGLPRAPAGAASAIALSPMKRLEGINAAELAKINVATENRLVLARRKASDDFSRLVVELTKQEKIDAAIAVKKLAENPDSEELRQKAPAEAKPVMSSYDLAKTSIEADRQKAKDALKTQLLKALDGELKAAMKAGDLDTTVALKKIIAAGGFDAAPVAPASGDADPNVASGETPATATEKPSTGTPGAPDTPFGKRE